MQVLMNQMVSEKVAQKTVCGLFHIILFCKKEKNLRLAKFEWTSRPPVRVVNPICGVQCSAKRGETRFSTAKIQKDFWRCFSSLNSTLKAHFKLWRHFRPLQFCHLFASNQSNSFANVIVQCSSHFHFHFILSEFFSSADTFPFWIEPIPFVHLFISNRSNKFCQYYCGFIYFSLFHYHFLNLFPSRHFPFLDLAITIFHLGRRLGLPVMESAALPLLSCTQRRPHTGDKI